MDAVTMLLAVSQAVEGRLYYRGVYTYSSVLYSYLSSRAKGTLLIGFATMLIRNRGAYAARTVILAMVVPHEGSPAPIYR